MQNTPKKLADITNKDKLTLQKPLSTLSTNIKNSGDTKDESIKNNLSTGNGTLFSDSCDVHNINDLKNNTNIYADDMDELPLEYSNPIEDLINSDSIEMGIPANDSDICKLNLNEEDDSLLNNNLFAVEEQDKYDSDIEYGYVKEDDEIVDLHIEDSSNDLLYPEYQTEFV